MGGENDSQPCIDRCDELVKKMEEENKIEIAGKSIKDVFIAKSAGKPNPNHVSIHSYHVPSAPAGAATAQWLRCWIQDVEVIGSKWQG